MPSSRLGAGHSTHAIITFETTAGHFAAAYAPGANSNTPPAIVNKAECRLKLASTRPSP